MVSVGVRESVEPLEPGIIMAECYVRLGTMMGMGSCSRGSGVPDLLRVVAGSVELAGVKLRRAEKKPLNELNKGGGLRYCVMNPTKKDKVADRVTTAADKTFILVGIANHHAVLNVLLCYIYSNYCRPCQIRIHSFAFHLLVQINEALGRADHPGGKLDYSLRQDGDRAVGAGARIAAAMVRFYVHEGRAAEAFAALLLHKSLKAKMWPGVAAQIRQLPGVGPTIAGEGGLPSSVHGMIAFDRQYNHHIYRIIDCVESFLLKHCPPCRPSGCRRDSHSGAPGGHRPTPPGNHNAAQFSVW
jgi:ATP-dependent DNA helicase HFM1/MER3